jgi:hypothetical protein
VARLPVEFFDPTAKQQLLDLPSKELKRRALELLAQVYRLLPNEDTPTMAEVIRIGLKVPYGDEEQIYRQVGQALGRLESD